MCVLLAALAAVGLVLEFVNWAFGAEDIDVFRVLRALIFAALFAAGAMIGGRTGTLLIAYAALRLEPGPAYLAFFVPLVFVSTAALSGTADEGGFVTAPEQPTPTGEASLVGWPLVLALATVGASLWGLRRSAAQIAARS